MLPAESPTTWIGLAGYALAVAYLVWSQRAQRKELKKTGDGVDVVVGEVKNSHQTNLRVELDARHESTMTVLSELRSAMHEVQLRTERIGEEQRADRAENERRAISTSKQIKKLTRVAMTHHPEDLEHG